mgnify:CR=1 FL=1
MGKRRKHSKIDQLEPAVKETVDEMIKTGAYYREIVDYIQSHGVSISLAAVGKYAKNLMSTLDALRLSQENFRAIMEETDRYPDLDMTDGILRLLCNQMLDAINKLPEERLQEVDFDTLSKNAVALTRAVAYKKNVDVKTRDALENGAEQFRDLIFEAMAAERPDLYQEVRRFMKEKQKEDKALVSACQSVADRFWHSKLYFPACFLMLAVFMAAGLPVVGGVLVMSTLIFLLLFCDDLLSILFPVVLLAMVGTEFYDELYSLLRFWWIGLLAAAALLVHIGAYARAPRNGGCLHGMVAVSVATLLGGLGFISREEYFSPTALYYSLGLGVVMLLVYVLCRSEADRTRDYDVAERMLQILYAGGLFTGFVVALFYVRNLQEFLQDFATLYFKYRNFSATMLLIALPAAAYFAAHDRRHFLSVAFLYFMLLMTGSRSGLIFGTAMLLLCLAYVYYCNPERRAFYRRVGLISLIPAVALLIALVPRLFASRMVDGALISPDDSRYTFFIQGLLDFVKNPLFGCGLGSMHNAPIFLGVEGSIVWYHNLIAQILGSMGLVGVVGYGWLFYDRVRLLWRKRSRTTMAFALSYFAMLLISMTNPGMFCPMPNALLMVAMFVVVERQPDTAAVPVKVGSASTPERRLF